MAARRYTTEEVAAIIMNLPCDGDESELSDFEGSEGDEGDATLNDQDEMDEFSNVSEEEANSDTEDNPPVRHGELRKQTNIDFSEEFHSGIMTQTLRKFEHFLASCLVWDSTKCQK